MTMMDPSPMSAPVLTPSELSAIAEIIYKNTGIVISQSKTSMVQSRLAKRLRRLGLSNYQSYISLVSSNENAEELREMISALTTNVTHFFRENHHFETLTKEALPPLLARARAGERIRIWSAGSSNGQEAYSIAMTIAELDPNFERYDLRILATDIDPRMIATGREGIYPETVLETVPEPLQTKYFTRNGPDVQVAGKLRDLVSFKELNLHHSWPMKGQFNIIFCRNVVIYFDAEAQAKLWQRFEQKLAPGGWFFVGHSERVILGSHSELATAGVTTYRLREKLN